MTTDAQQDLMRWLAQQGAILILLALLTGGLVGAAMSGQIDADAHSLLASHLNALLGAFWVLAVAWSVPLLRYRERGARRLAWLVVGAQYANWLVTAWKALWKVSGVGVTGDARNNLILATLTLTVVLPSFAAALGWIYGLRRPATSTPTRP